MPLAVGIGIGVPTGGRSYDPVAALGTDLLEYWDPNIASLLTLNGSEVVTIASGKSGLAPTQGTSSARPTFNATALNGKAGMLFNSTNSQQLTVSAVGNLPTGSTPCWVWMICTQTALAATTGGKTGFAYGNGGAVGQYRSVGRVSSGSNRVNNVMGTGAADIAAAGTTIDLSGGVFLILAKMEASQVTNYVNGQADGSAAGTLGGTATTRTRFGAYPNTAGTAFWDGYIGETYVTNPLTSGKEADFLNYFKGRYGF